MKQQTLNYDKKNDILYFVLREGVEHHFVEVAEGITVEFDEDNQPIGLEIFNASKVMVSAIGQERLALAAA